MDNKFIILAEGGERGDDGLIKINVKAENVPKDLFGVSFYLRIDGEGWDLKGFESGNVFVGVDPMVLVREKDGYIVAGMSLRLNDVAGLNDGVLLSFFVEPKANGDYVMSFENGVASVFEGGRKDLDNVAWEGGEFGVTGILADENVVLLSGEDDADEDAEVLFAGLTEARADVLVMQTRGEGAGESALLDVYIFLAVALLVMLAGYLVYWRFGKGGFKR